MKKLNSLTTWVAGGLELLHWSSTLAALALFGATFFAGGPILEFFTAFGTELNVYGFEIDILTTGGPDIRAVRIFALAALILFPLMAMVYRNIRLILRTAQGRTQFSKGATPFQQGILRMVREIGYFYLAVPALGLLFSTIARLLLGVDAVELSVNLGGFVMGITILCLSQVFAQGVEMQGEVDGLI